MIIHLILLIHLTWQLIPTKMILLSNVAAYQLVDQNTCFDENSCLHSQGNVRFWHASTKLHSVAFQKIINCIFIATRISDIAWYIMDKYGVGIRPCILPMLQSCG